ncbi:copper resistance CopC/CopD family protein [Saccharopolyspora soli]|uniref:copper resistance CopC/CopD family protein n=1 Tax=Saccharopolyspora soli TaxID=2926618 RepID=UPI001F57909B|nr:copper resistance protein CopC [Saccharopolyspora soli]
MVLRRLLGVLGVLLILLVTNPGTASAHAVLLGTTPGNFEVLTTAPREVTLQFNEPVDIGLAEIRLIGPGGAEVAGIGRPTHPPERLDVVAATLPTELAAGTYTVAFRVVSTDAHPVPGAFAFSVGQVTGGVASSAGPETGGAGGAVSALYGVARWLAYVGLALLVGTAFFVAACWPGGEVVAGVRRLLWNAWGILFAGTLGAFVAYGPYAAGGSIGDLADPALLGSTLGSRMGVVLAVRLGLLGLVAAALVHALRRAPFAQHEARDQRLRTGLVLVGAVVLVVTWSLASHNASGAQVVLALPVDAAHLLAMAVWLGGLPVLLGVLLRSRDVVGMRIAIPRFSRTALVCVGVLVVTGTYQAWREVGTPSALFGTTYGAVLAVKLGVVVLLVGSGALARNWVRRHYGFDAVAVADKPRTRKEKRRARSRPGAREVSRFRRLIAVELALAAAVLGVTVSLVSAEPATAELARMRAAAETPTRVGPVSGMLPFDAGGGEQGVGKLAVLVTPGVVGRNEVHLAVFDANGRPKQVPELRAELRLPTRSVGPLPVDLQVIGGTHAISPNVPITMPGEWEIAVTVRTSEIDQTVVRIPIGAR